MPYLEKDGYRAKRKAVNELQFNLPSIPLIGMHGPWR